MNSDKIEQAKQTLKENGFITYGLWRIDDIKDKATELGFTLSPKDYQNILDLIEHNFDANNGINWDVIQFNIEDYCADRGIESGFEEELDDFFEAGEQQEWNNNLEKAKKYWQQLGDIPINDQEEIEEAFLHFPIEIFTGKTFGTGSKKNSIYQ